MADALNRLGLSSGIQQREDLAEPPYHPLHYLQDDPQLMLQLQSLSQDILRQPLTLDRLSGQVTLRLGQVDVEVPTIEAVTKTYREALSYLPKLESQGDGMRSLLGLLVPIIAATYPMVFVDEPEAFLHPPQALALGRVLGDLSVSRHLQVVVATHDRNLLSGLLESGAAVSVVRLQGRERVARFTGRCTKTRRGMG